MPAFVQVSEDQNSAVLWPERPLVLKFVPAHCGDMESTCNRCYADEVIRTTQDRDLCFGLPCSPFANAPRTDGQVGYFARVEGA